MGEAEGGFLCIDTASPAWRWLMLKDRLAASAAAGHEYVHVLQGELGCLHSPSGESFRWLMEGMAEDVSLAGARRRASHDAKRGSSATIRGDGAFDKNLEPLQTLRDRGRP